MEFEFDVNKILPSTITFVDCKRCPFRKNSPDVKSLQKQLDKVIDSLGNASCKAQGLHTIITTAMKLQHSDHELYILKDATANGGRGAVIGMIKVGKKTLFLLDIHGIQNEVIPLCVMDFYVHNSRQRTGCGKKLFEYILKIHNLLPSQVAIDRPSFKFLSFLKKHYGLQNSISQSNNFLVFDQFFRDLNVVGYVPRRSQRMTSGNQPNRPPVHPYRRNSANNQDHPPSSSQPSSRRLSSRRSSSKDQVMDVDSDEITKTCLPPLVNPSSQEISAGSARSTDSVGSRESSANSQRGLLAHASLYSRHGSADMVRRTNSRNNQTWSNRNAVSAGTTKSLHASSQDNPLAVGYTFANQSSISKQQSSPQSSYKRSNTFQQNLLNMNTTKPNLNTHTSSSGSYTLSSVLNSQKSPSSSSRGTSWNIFGISSSENQKTLP